jgi:uncharacterized membrane protein
MSKGAKMLDLLSRSYVQAGLSVLGLAVVSVIAYYVLSRLRDLSNHDQSSPADLLKNFEEMRQEGDINESEFRNIQSLLKSDSKHAS